MKRIFNQSNLFFLGNSASVSAAAAVVASDVVVIVVDAFVVVVVVDAFVVVVAVVVDAFVVVVAVVVVCVDNVFLEKLIFWVDLSSIYKQPIRPKGDHITKIFYFKWGLLASLPI